MALSASVWSITESNHSLSTQHKTGCYIYVIHEIGSAFYKIGITKNPEKRLAALQLGNSRRLIFKRIVYVEDVTTAKRCLHQLMFYRASKDGCNDWLFIPRLETHILYGIIDTEVVGLRLEGSIIEEEDLIDAV